MFFYLYFKNSLQGLEIPEENLVDLMIDTFFPIFNKRLVSLQKRHLGFKNNFEILEDGKRIFVRGQKKLIVKIFNEIHLDLRGFPDSKGKRAFLLPPGFRLLYWVSDRAGNILKFNLDESKNKYFIAGRW